MRRNAFFAVFFSIVFFFSFFQFSGALVHLRGTRKRRKWERVPHTRSRQIRPHLFSTTAACNISNVFPIITSILFTRCYSERTYAFMMQKYLYQPRGYGRGELIVEGVKAFRRAPFLPLKKWER